MDRIAKGLEADGILTGAGKTKWWTSTINKILHNEKYIGDALLQKTYTIDFLNKTRVKNNDIVPQYYVEGNHEAIIPKDIFLRVQEELVRRRVVKTSANGKKRSYSCNHCFAQIVICGECGEMFRRIHWNNRGCKSIVWPRSAAPLLLSFPLTPLCAALPFMRTAPRSRSGSTCPTC